MKTREEVIEKKTSRYNGMKFKKKENKLK